MRECLKKKGVVYLCRVIINGRSSCWRIRAELNTLISVTANNFDLGKQSYTVCNKILVQISHRQFSVLCN